MASYTTTSTVDIVRPAEDVYDFVTTPRNWEGTHPVTAYVSGAQADRPTKVGRVFHEHIIGPLGPEGPAVEAIWDVTRAERGHGWTIESRYFDGRRIDVTITYRFDQDDRVCTLTRTMTTELPGEGSELAEAALTDPAVHLQYLVNLQHHLQEEHPCTS